MRTAALERLVRREPRPGAAERCDLCGEPVGEPHRHLLDVGGHAILCACQACWLLFDREGASEGRYRQVPRRRTRLPAVPARDLGVPVGLAFFVIGDDGVVRAHYPSPAGSTQWEIDPESWRRTARAFPELAGLAPEVEALLINTARDRDEHWLVPIDECFRLVAVIRREWRGLSGGGTVWPEIDEFFAGLGR